MAEEPSLSYYLPIAGGRKKNDSSYEFIDID